MKTTPSILLFLLAFSVGTSFGQIIPLPTDPCGPLAGTDITDNGNGTYSTTIADLYSWQVASGNATIISGWGTSTITVSCNGPFTLSVVRIKNNRPSSNCVPFNCNSGCPGPNSLSFFPTTNDRDRCTGITVSLNGASPSTSFNWNWTSSFVTGSLTTTSPFNFPLPIGNWDNQYFEVCANLTINGISCPEVCASQLLDCEHPFIHVRKQATVFPNPTTDLVSVSYDSNHELSRVIVTDHHGNIIRSLEQDFTQELDLSKEKKGNYFVRLLYKDGTSETKQLQLVE